MEGAHGLLLYPLSRDTKAWQESVREEQSVLKPHLSKPGVRGGDQRSQGAVMSMLKFEEGS